MLEITQGNYDRNRHCGYCHGNGSFSYGFNLEKADVTTFKGLIDRGFRRSGRYCYKSDLSNGCCPQYTIRLEVDKFKATKEQRQIVNRFNRYISNDQTNSELSHHHKGKDNNQFNLAQAIHVPETECPDKFRVHIEKNTFTEEKFELYKLYQMNVHNEQEEDVTREGFVRFLCQDIFSGRGNDDDEVYDDDKEEDDDDDDNEDKKFGAFHQMYYHNDKLIAIGVLDILPECVSSVYLIWHPDYARFSLGKLSVLREIALAQEYDLPYYYLGFYIHSCKKMRYKADYSPSFLLDPDYAGQNKVTWSPLEEYQKLLDQQKYVALNSKNDELEHEDISDDILSSYLIDSDHFYSNNNFNFNYFPDLDPSDLKTFLSKYPPPNSVIEAGMPGVLSRKQLVKELRKADFSLTNIPFKIGNAKFDFSQLHPSWQMKLFPSLEDLAAVLGVEIMKKVCINS